MAPNLAYETRIDEGDEGIALEGDRLRRGRDAFGWGFGWVLQPVAAAIQGPTLLPRFGVLPKGSACVATTCLD